MEFKCPACSRTVFNRRRKRCEFCGAAIPEELLRTDEEQAAIDAAYREASALTRERRRERERREREQTAEDGASFLGF